MKCAVLVLVMGVSIVTEAVQPFAAREGIFQFGGAVGQAEGQEYPQNIMTKRTQGDFLWDACKSLTWNRYLDQIEVIIERFKV